VATGTHNVNSSSVFAVTLKQSSVLSCRCSIWEHRMYPFILFPSVTFPLRMQRIVHSIVSNNALVLRPCC
jgi:hypothetical protein